MNELTQRLRTFLKVAEHQSFNVAARELDIASSTATRHVNHLERQLGEPLLVRTTRHVRLSPAGERALIRFRAILAEVDQLEGELESLSERVAGPLRILVPWRYSRLYLAPLVSEFMQCYPEVALDIVSSDQRVDLVEDHLDVALRIGHLEDSSLIARHISDQRFALAAAPSYLAAQPPIHQPQDLEQHRLMTFPLQPGDAVVQAQQHRDAEHAKVGEDTVDLARIDLLVLGVYLVLAAGLLLRGRRGRFYSRDLVAGHALAVSCWTGCRYRLPTGAPCLHPGSRGGRAFGRCGRR